METNETSPVTAPASAPVKTEIPPVTRPGPVTAEEAPSPTPKVVLMIDAPGTCLKCGVTITSPTSGKVPSRCFCGGKIVTVPPPEPAKPAVKPPEPPPVTDQDATVASQPAKEWWQPSEKAGDGGWVAADRRPGFRD